MRPIGLVRVFGVSQSEPFYVNPDHIVSFVPGWNPITFGSYIKLSVGDTYAVRETPEQIIGRLADHRSTMRAEARDEIVTYRP